MEDAPLKMLKLTMKQNIGPQFEQQIAFDGSTVLDLKKACVEKAGTSPELMRIIYKGKVLKNDITLEDYKIPDGEAVFLVKSSVKRSQQLAPKTSVLQIE